MYVCTYVHTVKINEKKIHKIKQRSENKRQTSDRNGPYQGHMYICYVQLLNFFYQAQASWRFGVR